MLHKTGVTCAFEHFPAAVGDALIERGSHHGRADVAGTATNQARLFDLAETVGVFKIGQTAQRLILVWTPAIEIGFVACTFGSTEAFGRVGIDADDITLKIMLVGTKVVGVVPVTACFGATDGILGLIRRVFDLAVLFAGPKRARSMA